MNSPANSEKQVDHSWGWDHHHQQHHHNNQHNHNHNHSGVTMSVGLETRQFQGGRVLDYEWGGSTPPVLLSAEGGGRGHGMTAEEDSDERKPQIMSGPLMDNMGVQYNGNVVALNGMLASGMSHNNIMAAAAAAANNPLANLLTSGTRNYGVGQHVPEGIRSSSSSIVFPGGNGHILSGFGPGGYSSDSRTALEEQRHHLLGLMGMGIGMDQKSIFHNMVKQEEVCGGGDFQARIGLNLGGRTYFSTEDNINIVNRLYKRPRAISPGSQVPRCQAEGCKADLSAAKHYHRRHKVCELHSKAATVVSGGISQRFCQQCSRFHVLSEFDEGKRSCRKRLADHNRRRRKPQPQPQSQANGGATVNASNGEAASGGAKASEDQETNSGSNQSNVQSEPISTTEAQGLLTGISLSPSLPLVLQSSKGQGQEQYLQQASPSLSRGEIGLEYPRHSTGENKFNGLEIAIPWLKPADSSSEFGGSEKNSSTGQVSESGGSSSTVQVFSSIQNLLPSLQSSTELGSSDWMVSGSLSGSNGRNQQQHHHYGSGELNLESSLEGQQMLSLLDKDRRPNACDGGRQTSQNAVEYLSQRGLNSKHGVDGHSELSTGFSGMQSLRSLGQSMYHNIL